MSSDSPLPSPEAASLNDEVHVSRIRDAILDLREGRMVVSVDAESRENAGDLLIASQMARLSAMNFMVRFGRAPICLNVMFSCPASLWRCIARKGSVAANRVLHAALPKAQRGVLRAHDVATHVQRDVSGSTTKRRRSEPRSRHPGALYGAAVLVECSRDERTIIPWFLPDCVDVL